MWHSRPPRDHPPFMANAILNFHFDYWPTSLTTFLRLLTSTHCCLADYVQCTVRHLKWTNCYSSPKIFLSHCWWISQQLWIKILINLQLGRRQTLSRLQEVTKLGLWGSSTVHSSRRGRIRGSWSGTLESTSFFWGLGFIVYTTVSVLRLVAHLLLIDCWEQKHIA